MKISKTSIKALKPCSDRFDNYLKFYSSKAHSPAQFLGLKNITHADKVWVSSRLIKPELRRLAAADIAELVLPIFEAKYPNDLRPRQAIAAARDLSLSEEELDTVSTLISVKVNAIAYYVTDAIIYAAAYSALRAVDTSIDSASSFMDATAISAAVAASQDPKVLKKIRTILLKYLNRS